MRGGVERNVKSVIWQIILLCNLICIISKPENLLIESIYWKHIFMEANKGANFKNIIIFVKSRKSHINVETQKWGSKIEKIV